jgi:hypothetical protein
VPNSQCSLRENPKFFQNFRAKITHSEKNFDQYSGMISAIVIQAWHSKAKTIKLLPKIWEYFIREKFQNLCQKTK